MALLRLAAVKLSKPNVAEPVLFIACAAARAAAAGKPCDSYNACVATISAFFCCSFNESCSTVAVVLATAATTAGTTGSFTITSALTSVVLVPAVTFLVCSCACSSRRVSSSFCCFRVLLAREKKTTERCNSSTITFFRFRDSRAALRFCSRRISLPFLVLSTVVVMVVVVTVVPSGFVETVTVEVVGGAVVGGAVVDGGRGVESGTSGVPVIVGANFFNSVGGCNSSSAGRFITTPAPASAVLSLFIAMSCKLVSLFSICFLSIVSVKFHFELDE